MRIKMLQLYGIEELKTQHPYGYRAAIRREQTDRSNDGYVPWSEEIAKSFKETIKALDFDLKDYSITAYSLSQARVSHRKPEVDDFAGRRAYAWLEACLGKYRPLLLPASKRLNDWRKTNPSLRYQRYTKPGAINACPFTAYWADEAMLESIRESLKDGATLKESLEMLAHVAARLLEEEIANYESEEECLLALESEGEVFDSEGAKHP